MNQLYLGFLMLIRLRLVVFFLLAGRLGDLLGRKIIFLLGLFIFGFSSLVVGLSTSSEMMIIARAVQGIGSAILAPTSLALLMDTYKGDLRVRAISYYGATGNWFKFWTYSRWLAHFGSFMACWLLLNVPFSLLLIILTLVNVHQSDIKASKIDFLGSFLSVLISVLFVFGITVSNLFIIILSFILIILFILWEKS